jgi:hypothetical protein
MKVSECYVGFSEEDEYKMIAAGLGNARLCAPPGKIDDDRFEGNDPQYPPPHWSY